LYRKIARYKNCVFSSHRTLRIFSEIFVFLILHLIGNYFYQHEKMGWLTTWDWQHEIIINFYQHRKLKNSEKILRILWEENKQFLLSHCFSVKLIKKLLKTNIRWFFFLLINNLLTIAKNCKIVEFFDSVLSAHIKYLVIILEHSV